MTTILNYSMIKKVLIVLPFYFFTFLPLSAQTYTQRIQQQNGNGQGTVTIHQDADIDKLVNSEVLNNNTKQTTTANQPAASHVPTTPGAKTATNKPATSNSVTTGNEGEDETTPDLSKKVMRGGVKVSGYRVQAFAGGNSRNDRIQAERIGNNIKSHFANVPVYVHFYSPRWICRVGNYRTYEEAHQMLVQLRNLGYNQASIVKGKITVQY